MHNKFITPAYLISIIMQALFGLILPIGAMLLLSWALVTYLSVGGFIYAVLIPIGALFGLYTMVSFILRASAALELVEKQRKEQERASVMKEQGQIEEGNTKESDTKDE